MSKSDKESVSSKSNQQEKIVGAGSESKKLKRDARESTMSEK